MDFVYLLLHIPSMPLGGGDTLIAYLPICLFVYLPICQLPIAYCLLFVAYCLWPIAYCLLPGAYTTYDIRHASYATSDFTPLTPRSHIIKQAVVEDAIMWLGNSQETAGHGP